MANLLSRADLARKGFVRQLFEQIVQSGVCSGCAACVLSCPVAALEYRGDKPVLLDNCIDCQLCSNACHRLAALSPDSAQVSPAGSPASVFAARAVDPAIRQAAQDGGAVTAILAWAFGRGLIDSAIVSQPAGPPLHREPALVRSVDELIITSGSTYTYSANTLALAKAAERGLTKVAFVGTGCQIEALRRLQSARSKKLRAVAAPVALAIGLLCSESFDYQPFVMEAIGHGLGVDLGDVAKVNIKGKVLVTLRSGETRSIPLKTVRPFARQGCQYCQDFGAEEADISTGGLGLDGWTVTTLRTPIGERFFSDAVKDGALEATPGAEFPAAIALYERLAAAQRERPRRPSPRE